MTRTKIKTARAIEPNVATRNAFSKKLLSLSRAFSLYVADEIILMLIDKGMIAEDASLSNPRTKYEKEKLKHFYLRIVEFYRANPAKAKEDIDEYVRKNLPKWTTELTAESQKVASWFVRNLARDVTASQRRALRLAGFPDDFMKTMWNVQLVRGQYISPQAAEKLPQIVEETTSLITKMSVKDVQTLQEVIAEGLLKGQNIKEVRTTLHSFSGFDEARAKRVALDQSIKINQAIQRENSKSIGITQGIWQHVPGQYTSRETHKKMHGKIFDLDKGLWDEDVGRFVTPGSEYYCRCIWRPVIPKGI